MDYGRVKQGKISDVVAQQLEKNILQGIWSPGDKLPPERELATQMSVSRPSLRTAIQQLEKQGLVETRQGGGTYVQNFLAPSLTDPLMQMFQTNPDTAMDFVEFRSIIEGNAAYLAAMRSTDADRELLQACFESMEEAHEDDDPHSEAEIDADFHLIIAESSHNAVLLHIMRAMVNILREGVFYNRMQLYTRRGARDLLLKQHRAIYEPIMAGDPDQARQAAKAHLAYVQEIMRDLEREESRQDVSRRRLERYLEKKKDATQKPRRRPKKA
ncbi:FCD domain-containing protein [Terasakiella sp. A23]|uniref:FCD domain-containing protein n=1 Tax=Terasakiella sp. FCG-A23 TaxID=3080561 RepID=UPI002953FC53|nr:FCD domain-containing protein [Terasakiella sp. A23]MDV7339352.1 FCD domain-containing protein [Terasakiella sp. A23]